MFFSNFARKFANMKKKTYIKGFFAVVTVLAVTRLIWPEVAIQKVEGRREKVENSQSLDSAQNSNLYPLPSTLYLLSSTFLLLIHLSQLVQQSFSAKVAGNDFAVRTYEYV